MASESATADLRAAAGRAPRALVVPAVAGILSAAIGLRFWRLAWGLEEGLCFPDEQMLWIASAAKFYNLSWDSFSVEWLPYPTLYQYLAGLANALAWASGILDATEPFGLRAILVARVVSAAAGVAAVGAVGLLARRAYGVRAGFAAAALAAVLPLEVVQVHYASVDVVLYLACAATLLASHRLASRGTAAAAALAGLAAGLAFAAKYTGAVMAAPVAWALLEAGWRDRSPRGFALRGTAALAGLAGGVLLGCPYCVLRSDLMWSFLAWLRYTDVEAFTAVPNAHLAPTLGWYGRPWLYPLVASLPYALGWPLYLLSLWGLWDALRGRGLADRALLASLAPAFLVIGSANVTYPRYLLPLCPVLLVLAARAGVAARSLRTVRGAAFAAALVYTAALAASQVARTSYDQQLELARWLGSARKAEPDAIPATVGVPAHTTVYYRLCEPLKREGLACAPIADDAWLATDAALIVIPVWYEITMQRDRPEGPAADALARIAAGETGFREVRRWRSWFLQQELYRRLDPAFAVELTQGSVGFTVYARGAAASALERSAGGRSPTGR